jgi:uncharacterized protein (TIGR02678 family)
MSSPPPERATAAGGATAAAAALTDVLDLGDAAERQRAARALLATPLLTSADPLFPLVRRHATELADWFAREAGWTLTVTAESARLRKIPASPVDGTRPASARGSDRAFQRRRYVLLCLALAALERSDAQVTLGHLADRVIDAATDPALAGAGVAFRMETRDERGDLAAVVRLLLGLGVLSRVAGDEDAYVKATGDALYDVRRRVLADLLAAPRAPSAVTAPTFDERLAALSDELLADTAEARTRAARRSLTRRLLDDPVLYYEDLPEAEQAYLASQRAAVVRRVADATGLEAEVRAEGIALLDPTGEATDLGMPEDGTEGHVTLLLAEHLAQVAGPVGLAELEARTAGLVREHGKHWRKAAREPGAERQLCARAVGRLQALGLLRRDADAVVPLPALARFAVEEPRILGERPDREPAP